MSDGIRSALEGLRERGEATSFAELAREMRGFGRQKFGFRDETRREVCDLYADKMERLLEALAAYPAPLGTTAEGEGSMAIAGHELFVERTRASMEAFEAWLAKELEDGEPSYHEAWDAGEAFRALTPPTPAQRESLGNSSGPQHVGGDRFSESAMNHTVQEIICDVMIGTSIPGENIQITRNKVEVHIRKLLEAANGDSATRPTPQSDLPQRVQPEGEREDDTVVIVTNGVPHFFPRVIDQAKLVQPLTPTYYVRHPDDSYSIADPQPRATQPLPASTGEREAFNVGLQALRAVDCDPACDAETRKQVKNAIAEMEALATQPLPASTGAAEDEKCT